MVDHELDTRDLIDSHTFHDPIDVTGEDVELLTELLKGMLTIRSAERKLARGRQEGEIGGPVHLGVGQEAVAVGMAVSLRRTDRVFGAHRSHSHLLSLGSSVRKLFAEVLGRESGHSKGLGGSMHLWDEGSGFYGSVPIVAGTVPLAVGAAMASRLQGKDDVAVSYLGDGACEEGVFHESLNLASIQKDPVIFVVENNLFASHMHWSKRQPAAATARFAKAHSIPYKVVDGNNVLEVMRAGKELIECSRQGQGPGFLEAFTYRWFGHVDWREDIDVGVNRSQDDVQNWRAKDPVKRLAEGMIRGGCLNSEQLAIVENSIEKEIDGDWLYALEQPYPTDFLGSVYK